MDFFYFFIFFYFLLLLFFCFGRPYSFNFQLRSTVLDISDGSSEGIVFDSSAGLVAIRSENYCIQFYSLFDDREVSEVSG